MSRMKLPIILLIFYLKIPEATSNLNTTILLLSQSYNSSINKSFQVRSISNNNNNISRPSSIKQYADKLKTFQDVALINSEFIYLASTNGVLYQFSKNSKINNNNCHRICYAYLYSKCWTEDLTPRASSTGPWSFVCVFSESLGKGQGWLDCFCNNVAFTPSPKSSQHFFTKFSIYELKHF